MPQKTEPNLGLAYGWNEGESGWKPGMDSNILKIGAVSQLTVYGIADSPTETTNGSRYIVSDNPTGVFAGQAGNLAIRRDSVWYFLSPYFGWRALDVSTLKTMVFVGSTWIDLPSPYPSVDAILDVSNPGAWTFSNASYTKIPLFTKTTDTMGGWGSNGTDYQVPFKGLYQVNAIARPIRSGAGALPDNSAIALGVGSTPGDSQEVVWGSGPATGVLFSLQVNRVMALTAGQTISLFSKHSHTASVGFTSARLQLVRISD